MLLVLWLAMLVAAAESAAFDDKVNATNNPLLQSIRRQLMENNYDYQSMEEHDERYDRAARSERGERSERAHDDPELPPLPSSNGRFQVVGGRREPAGTTRTLEYKYTREHAHHAVQDDVLSADDHRFKVHDRVIGLDAEKLQRHRRPEFRSGMGDDGWRKEGHRKPEHVVSKTDLLYYVDDNRLRRSNDELDGDALPSDSDAQYNVRKVHYRAQDNDSLQGADDVAQVDNDAVRGVNNEAELGREKLRNDHSAVQNSAAAQGSNEAVQDDVRKVNYRAQDNDELQGANDVAQVDNDAVRGVNNEAELGREKLRNDHSAVQNSAAAQGSNEAVQDNVRKVNYRAQDNDEWQGANDIAHGDNEAERGIQGVAQNDKEAEEVVNDNEARRGVNDDTQMDSDAVRRFKEIERDDKDAVQSANAAPKSDHERVQHDNTFPRNFVDYEELYNDDDSITTPKYKYKLFKVRDRDGRRRAAPRAGSVRRYLQEQGAEGVALVSLDAAPVPQFKLPRARRQYMHHRDHPRRPRRPRRTDSDH